MFIMPVIVILRLFFEWPSNTESAVETIRKVKQKTDLMDIRSLRRVYF